MQTVILAAGKGKRLHPITLTRSKAMLPILGKPIVERVMEQFASAGLNDFILVISPEDNQITQYFQRESKIEASVRFVYQEKRLGAAHALRYAVPLIRGDFYLSACDNLTSPHHIGKMYKLWHSESRPNGILTLMKVEQEQVENTAVVIMERPWVTRIVEKPALEEAPSQIASLPLYCLKRKFLDYLPEVGISQRGEYELQDAIQMLIEKDGKVHGLMVTSRLTLTNPADLLKINQYFFASGYEDTQLQPKSVGENTRLLPPLLIEGGTVIGANCTIGPNVYIERDSQIVSDARIRDAVLLQETTVPAGAVISNQIIY
ncbi:sugar phosphate nucleotidyltransferase [Chloroflexota bacterium]